MDQNEIVGVVERERLRLCDVLDELQPEEWAAPSLCAGWTVREVVAHLTVPTRTSWPQVIAGAIRARGSFDRMATTWARQRASRFSSAELRGQLRETAASPRRMPGSGPMDPLVDVLVHGQDIVRPLGRSLPVPVGVGAAVLPYAVGNAFLGGPARCAGLRLVASDASCRAGEGPSEVRGPVEDLLLVSTGRPAGLEALSGSGLDLLRGRLSGTPAGRGR